MKFCILKPVTWNDNGYTKACGSICNGDNFVSKYGYGHEEWNNARSMKYQKRAYFHSEAKDSLCEKAQGNMCILLIAAHEGKNYIVGVAAGVSANKESDLPTIAKTLNLYDKGKEVWNVDLVKEKFGHDIHKFKKHWNENYSWIRWSCPEELFYWFSEPIQFDPSKVTEKNTVVKMHSSWQYVPQEVMLDLLNGILDFDHPIIDWLLEGEFEPCKNPSSAKQKKKYLAQKNKHIQSGSNRPTEMLYEYWVEGKRVVHPRHSVLQNAFVCHLESQGIKCEQNTSEYIDITYSHKGNFYIVEVKPSEIVGTKYAIRQSIGQLLEYRHTIKKSDAKLHIVLDQKPTKQEIDFVKSLGIILSYQGKSGEFHTLG